MPKRKGDCVSVCISSRINTKGPRHVLGCINSVSTDLFHTLSNIFKKYIKHNKLLASDLYFQ